MCCSVCRPISFLSHSLVFLTFFFSLLYFNLPLTIWLLASTDFFFCCKSLDLVHISRNNAFTPEVCCPRPTRCVCLISTCRHATKTKERKHTVDVIWPFWNRWWDNPRPNVLAAGSGNWNSTPEVTTLKACVVSHTHTYTYGPTHIETSNKRQSKQQFLWGRRGNCSILLLLCLLFRSDFYLKKQMLSCYFGQHGSNKKSLGTEMLREACVARRLWSYVHVVCVYTSGRL